LVAAARPFNAIRKYQRQPVADAVHKKYTPVDMERFDTSVAIPHHHVGYDNVPVRPPVYAALVAYKPLCAHLA
jgi:hypothetical protein